MCWDPCQVSTLQVSVIYFSQLCDASANNTRPILQMRGLRLSEFTCSRLPCWEVAGLRMQLRTGLWTPCWSGVSSPLPLSLLRKGRLWIPTGQGHDNWLHSFFTAQNRPRGCAEAENQPVLCWPRCAPWRRGTFWVPGGLGACAIWTGDLALLLVSKSFSFLEPQISHPANGVITSTGW